MEYIWIDSICIIQDSEEDWRRQSEQMGTVYRMSYCTLAAVDAHVDGEEDKGLLLERDKIPVSALLENDYTIKYDNMKFEANNLSSPVYSMGTETIDVKEKSDLAWKSSKITLKPNLTTFQMSIELSDWNFRSWIFQERMLSTRILYFTKEQIFWECAEKITSEHIKESTSGKPLSSENTPEEPDRLHKGLRYLYNARPEVTSSTTDLSGGTLSPNQWNEYQTHKVWWTVVERYSATKLTLEGDKWYAIAGLCSILQTHFQSAIHAGVWENAVGAGILWHARDHALQKHAEFHASSWSWLGVNGAVAYSYEDESYTGYVQEVKSLYQNASFTKSETSSNVEQSSLHEILHLRCPSKKIGISSQKFGDFTFNEVTGGHDHDPPAWQFFHQTSHGKSQLELSKEFRSQTIPSRTRLLTADDDGRAVGWVVLDFDDDNDIGSDIYAAAIVHRTLRNSRTPEQHITECVVLVPELMEPDMYRRVGRGRIVEQGWLSECAMQEFNIV